jgi:hypothetical protein
MANPRKNWEALIKNHADRLGVIAALTGDGVGKYERVFVQCTHGSHTVMACRFMQKCYCCRKEARKWQTGREGVSEKIRAKNLGKRDSLETRLKKAEAVRKRGALRSQDDLFYVASRGESLKVGRCALHNLIWLKRLNLSVIAGWELDSENAYLLERRVHAQFCEFRRLDPSFGKGWTEIFDIRPEKIISFIENEIRA